MGGQDEGNAGVDIEGWPNIGRGSKFLPCKSGPSMVAELKVGNVWEALVAERLPQQLDDAIKECHFQFFDAAQKINPEELFELMP
eukprot:6839189-Pyramimonas_sp.AAC.1